MPAPTGNAHAVKDGFASARRYRVMRADSINLINAMSPDEVGAILEVYLMWKRWVGPNSPKSFENWVKKKIHGLE